MTKELAAADDEMNELNSICAKEIAEMERTYEEMLVGVQEEWDEKIKVVNNECMELLDMNSQKKEEVRVCSETECSMCPTLQRAQRKLEKHLIKMQVEERGLMLTDSNEEDVYRKLRDVAGKV